MRNLRSLTESLRNKLRRRGEGETRHESRDGPHSVDYQPACSLYNNPQGGLSPSGKCPAVGVRPGARRNAPVAKGSDNSSRCGCSASGSGGGRHCPCASGSTRCGHAGNGGCSTSGCGCGDERRQQRGRKRNNSNGTNVTKGARPSKVASVSNGRAGDDGSRGLIAVPAGVNGVPPTAAVDAGDASVRVIVRIRPALARESRFEGEGAGSESECCVQQVGHDSLCVVAPPGRSQFSYDSVLGPNVSQQKLFEFAGQSVVENCLAGYNSCIFAYGQTGSGKTYTMLGDLVESGQIVDAAGLIPRVFHYLFARIAEIQAANSSVSYFCKCSLLEIYNERITDLLSRATALQVREDAKRGVYVKGLTVEDVESVEDALSLLRRGSVNRRVGATGMNNKSSRSHCVLTCVIESRRVDGKGLTNILRSRLNLVDLAGSERQRSSGAAGRRLKEASSINRSLSTLGLVIMSLVNSQQGKKSKHVPYRDSKLTYLLQDSLGGNSKTVMIANVSPVACNLSETVSTLRFAKGAKLVRNRVIVNADITGDARLLKLEVTRLKEELARCRALLEADSSTAANAIVPAGFGPAGGVPHGLQAQSCPEPLVVDALRREDVAVKKATILEAQCVQLQVVVQLKDIEYRRLERVVKVRDSKIKRLEGMEGSTCTADVEVAELREEVEVLRAKLADNHEVTILSAENKQLSQELAALRAASCEREKTEDEMSRLREKVLDLEKQLAEARSYAWDCAPRAPSRAVAGAAALLDSAWEGHESMQELRELLEQEATKLEEATRCNRFLEERILLLEEANDKLREERAHMYEERALLAGTADGDGKVVQEICDLKEELAVMKVEKRELEDLLTDAVQAKHEMEMRRNEVSAQLLDVARLRDDLIKENQQLEEQVNMLRMLHRDVEEVTNDVGVQMSGECCSDSQEIAELRQLLREEQEKNSTLQGEFDMLKCQLENDVTTEITDCKNQLDWLLGELEETQQELNRTQGLLEDKEMDMDDVQEALTASERERKRLEDELQEKYLYIDQLELEKKEKVQQRTLSPEAKVAVVQDSKGCRAMDIIAHPWMKQDELECTLVELDGVDTSVDNDGLPL